MKKEEKLYATLREFTDAYGLTVEHRRYTQLEVIASVKRCIDGLSARIETAKNVYRRQEKELEDLKSPELWTFRTPNHIPPDYRAEYLRRLKRGLSEDGMKIVKT